jgi:hypothetical protein
VTENFLSFLEWIENTSPATAIRRSTWLYPFIEILHIFGIVLVAGAASLFDIYVLSARNRRNIEYPVYELLRWSKRGLILAIPTGLLLFSTNAMALGTDPVFGLKLLLLLIAAFNAWIFHVRVFLPFQHKNPETFNWPTARLNATFSILLWMSIISCGRLLAY